MSVLELNRGPGFRYLGNILSLWYLLVCFFCVVLFGFEKLPVGHDDRSSSVRWSSLDGMYVIDLSSCWSRYILAVLICLEA